MKLRWRDVARLAGVSESTVSRVMNGRPGVSEQTRATVMSAANDLGWLGAPPTGPTNVGLVGLVVPDFANPVFPEFVDIIQSTLSNEGFTCLLGCATRTVAELEFVEMLAARGVAGIITISGRHADTEADQAPYTRLIQDGMPIVFVNGYTPDVPAPFVSCDDHMAGQLAIRHLASLGHRRIGMLTGPDRYVVVQRRVQGWRSALDEVGADDDDSLLVRTMFTIEGGRSAVGELIDAGATAVVTANDPMALGAMLGARDRGLSVPDQLSVVGYDDSALMAYTDPPLTTVRQPAVAMCHNAVQLLLQARDTERANREYKFLPELVSRQSTAPLVRST